MHLQPPRASKKRLCLHLSKAPAAPALMSSSSCTQTPSLLCSSACMASGVGHTCVHACVQVHVCASGAERGEGHVHWECNARGWGCPGH